MRIRTICIFLCIALVTIANVLAQESEKSGMIKSAKGILVVWNEPGNYYTIEVVGNNIQPAAQPPPIYFQVDGRFLQIQTAWKSDFLKEEKGKSPDDKAVLTAHRDWEADYMSQLLKTKLKFVSEWVKLSDGTDALWWTSDVPEKLRTSETSAKKQLYLSVVKRDQVLLLNSVVTRDDNNEKAIRQFLLDTMKTMKSSDKPLSLKEASEQIKKGK